MDIVIVEFELLEECDIEIVDELISENEVDDMDNE